VAFPDVSTTITDGALGIVEVADRVCAVIGTSSAGTINTPTMYTDVAALVAGQGVGPAVECAAHILAVGGGAVLFTRVDNTSTPGTNGAVTPTGTGLSVMTVTGTPRDAYQVRVLMGLGGANPAAGTATFKYSLDGGDVYSAEIAMPTGGSYLLSDTGLTLVFSAASLVAADTYSFDSVAPGYNSTELTTAWTALVADPRTWKFVHVVGAATTASGQATIVGVLAALRVTAATNHRYVNVHCEMPYGGAGTAGDAAAIAAFAAVSAPFVCVSAGHAELTSVITGRIHLRSQAWSHSARRQRARISEHSGRVRSGALPGVISLARNEQIHRGLDAARFVTCRTIVGKAGFYVTSGRTMAAAGSDFSQVQRCELMNYAATIARATFIDELNESLRVNPATSTVAPGQPGAPGTLDERDARTIEARVRAALVAAILANGDCSAIAVQTNRTDNLLSTGTLRIRVRVTPLAYGETLTLDIGFENPALAVN